MITITIRTDNAAFQDGQRRAEVWRILRWLAEKINPETSSCCPGGVYDSNGNRVGEVRLTGKDRSL